MSLNDFSNSFDFLATARAISERISSGAEISSVVPAPVRIGLSARGINQRPLGYEPLENDLPRRKT